MAQHAAKREEQRQRVNDAFVLRRRTSARTWAVAWRVRGWLAHKRSSGKIRFLVLRDGSGLPAVRRRGERRRAPSCSKRCDRVPLESSLEVRGSCAPTPALPEASSSALDDLRVLHAAADFPIQPKEHGVEFLFDHRHLYLRSRTPQAVLRVRHEVLQALPGLLLRARLRADRLADPDARRLRGHDDAVRDRLLRQPGLS